MGLRGLDLSGSGEGQMASCSENSNVYLVLVKRGKFSLANWETISFSIRTLCSGFSYVRDGQGPCV